MINNRKVFILFVLLTNIIFFLFIDYEGSYYGLSSIFHFQNRIPFNMKIHKDKYDNYIIFDAENYEYLGPVFKVSNSENSIVSILGYCFNDSTLFIKCETASNVDNIDFCRNNIYSNLAPPLVENINNKEINNSTIYTEYYKVYNNTGNSSLNTIECKKISPLDKEINECSHVYTDLNIHYIFYWWFKVILTAFFVMILIISIKNSE